MSRTDKWCVSLLGAILFMLTSNTPASLAVTIAETRGLGARAIGMGGAFTGVADDISAVYYNPAGLSQVFGHRFYVEAILVEPDVSVEWGNGPSQPLVYRGIKMPMVGFTLDLGKTIKFPPRLVIGFCATLADNFKSAWKIRYGSARFDPIYPIYGDSNEEQGLGIWAGGGCELLPWLMVGGAVNFMLHAESVAADIALNTNLEPVKEQSKITLDITTEIFPLLGVLVKPTPNLRIGLAVREEGELVFGGGGTGMKLLAKLVLNPNVTLPVPIPLTLPIHGHYRPTQYAMGVSYRVREALLLALDLTYYDWRRFRDDAYREPDPKMDGVLVPRVGLEYDLLKNLAVRAGYGFQKSPLPQQRMGYHTNLLDNDVHSISLGLGYLWQIFGYPDEPAELSLFYQLQLLPSRNFRSVHPGEPDLRGSGLFHSFGFALRFHL